MHDMNDSAFFTESKHKQESLTLFSERKTVSHNLYYFKSTM